MMSFDFTGSTDPIRPDLSAQYQRVWTHIAAPGTWLTGAERVAVAAATRDARDCTLCRERKSALSPFSIDGAHATGAPSSLEPLLVDAVHRVATDAARLSKTWYDGMIAGGVSPERYVEALGVAVQVISIDEFHRALAIGLEPLPNPQEGAPTGLRPVGAKTADDAWVPTIQAADLGPDEEDLYDRAPGGKAPGVIKALSLVPAEVRSWKELAAAQYLSTENMMRMENDRALDRAQIELVAGRVSALNECFY